MAEQTQVTESLGALGRITVERASTMQKRMTGFLWSKVGVGKTGLIATLPGVKLVIGYDPDGETTIGHRSDVLVLPMYKHGTERTVDLWKDNGGGETQLRKIIQENPEIESVAFDSITSFVEAATIQAVKSGRAGKNVDVVQPGQAGYTLRNNYAAQAVQTILRVTGELNRHCFITAHEDLPDKNADGIAVSTKPQLSASLQTLIPSKISEIWHMRDDGKGNRRLAFKPFGIISPMRTRMFMPKSGEFDMPFNYDLFTDEGPRVADWWEAWKANNFNRIPVPGSK